MLTADQQEKLNRALELMNSHDPQAALLAIQEVVQAAPTAVEPFIYQGSAFNLAGQPDQAVGAYQRAIMNGPSNPMGYTYLAAQYESMGKFSEALSMAEEALKLDPKNVTTSEMVSRLKARFAQPTGPVPTSAPSDPNPFAASSPSTPAAAQSIYAPQPTPVAPSQPVASPTGTIYQPPAGGVRNSQDDPFAIPKWVWNLYYLFAAWWILDGVRVALAGLGLASESLAMGGVGTAFVGISVAVAFIGIVTAAVGLGLIFRWELARGVANIISFLQLGNALFGLAGALLGSLGAGLYAVPFMILFLVNLIVAAAQIYVIGETDNYRKSR
ncbi:MAG TPA: hypothetical protein PLO61_03490 [Fimbriimonadaceae bacterium]|nr:hypothetical protein [Fimbriimonadaceae bacterium]HRJ32693.1 hypothetical protein [Fimbriimonadaceae bacterium]